MDAYSTRTVGEGGGGTAFLLSTRSHPRTRHKLINMSGSKVTTCPLSFRDEESDQVLSLHEIKWILMNSYSCSPLYTHHMNNRILYYNNMQPVAWGQHPPPPPSSTPAQLFHWAKELLNLFRCRERSFHITEYLSEFPLKLSKENVIWLHVFNIYHILVKGQKEC